MLNKSNRTRCSTDPGYHVPAGRLGAGGRPAREHRTRCLELEGVGGRVVQSPGRFMASTSTSVHQTAFRSRLLDSLCSCSPTSRATSGPAPGFVLQPDLSRNNLNFERTLPSTSSPAPPLFLVPLCVHQPWSCPPPCLCTSASLCSWSAPWCSS